MERTKRNELVVQNIFWRPEPNAKKKNAVQNKNTLNKPNEKKQRLLHERRPIEKELSVFEQNVNAKRRSNGKMKNANVLPSNNNVMPQKLLAKNKLLNSEPKRNAKNERPSNAKRKKSGNEKPTKPSSQPNVVLR